MDWVRLEGGTVDPNLTEGIASALADPLWLPGPPVAGRRVQG